MFMERDEGIDLNSSVHRDFPSFVPDESTYRIQNDTQKSMIFPQRLDLSSLTPKTAKNGQNKKKISPIKANSDSRVQKSFNWTEIGQNSVEKRNHTIDLDAMRESFDQMAKTFTEPRKNSSSSVTSDRASSVTSTSSGQSLGQKSILVEVSRARKLIDERRRVGERQIIGETQKNDVLVLSDSDFHIDDDGRYYQEETEEDETRPPSSQPSLAFEPVEHARRGCNSKNFISSVENNRQKTRLKETAKKKRNTGTASDTVCLSDSQLYEIYEKRCSQDEVTLTEHSPIDNDHDKTIVDEVFEDFHHRLNRLSDKETPILRSAGRDTSNLSLGSQRIERARDASAAHRSASLNNIMSATTATANRRMATNQEERFDGIAPGALRHSMSTVQVSREKLRELQKEHNYPIQSLARFVIRPSTRDIFPLPLDIDAISGKGLRRDEKSTQRNFGGKSASVQIHGERPSPRITTIPQKSSSGASRPTTSSAAKKVGFQSNLAPNSKISKNFTKNSNSRQLPPPYCSATSSDGTAYSIATVTQQLLGTVKSLHPDWLPTIRRILNDDDVTDDVIGEFRGVLHVEKTALEEKFKKNRNETPFDEQHFLAKISSVSRILERLETLANGGGHVSRIQQIKMIHSALLST
ncbi:hypothetical protein GCK72_003242 [Caenorhabditis remanei]|uniref:Uncharacterized protein n=1 Tax=Caenorhabditis remanei TaxID=31234 RepID=A0A6A5HWV7_CAERE|nr:hypothetical protein GCK72_003242 [Caenorhabditis remanei]KAF1771416.1 hypothetical protein GCK72_003242 [Caenorhabditis remanei]